MMQYSRVACFTARRTGVDAEARPVPRSPMIVTHGAIIHMKKLKDPEEPDSIPPLTPRADPLPLPLDRAPQPVHTLPHRAHVR